MTVTKIAWEDSIWFSDIDDTLIDTAGTSTSASEGIKIVLAPHCGETKAQEVQSNFNAAFNLMVQGYRVRSQKDWQNIDGGKKAFDDQLNDVESRQLQIKKDYGHAKKWSREIFIKLAAEKANIEITPDLVHEAADAYWLTLTQKVKIFPDAKQLSDVISKHQRPLYLVTSSDARLKMLPSGQFIYGPEYSEALKRQRIELLRNRGLQFNMVSIGDPEDKPHLDFFTKAIRIAEAELGHSVDLSKAIMLGDSFDGDLQTPKQKLGFGLVVLRENKRTKTKVNDNHQLSVGNLLEITNYLLN